MPKVNSLHIDKGFNDLLRSFLFALYQLYVATESFNLKRQFEKNQTAQTADTKTFFTSCGQFHSAVSRKKLIFILSNYSITFINKTCQTFFFIKSNLKAIKTQNFLSPLFLQNKKGLKRAQA